MKMIKIFLNAYFKNGLLFLIIIYLITAPRAGPFVFRWNIQNLYLTCAYLMFYPLIILASPKQIVQKIKFTSVASKSYNQDIKDIPS